MIIGTSSSTFVIMILMITITVVIVLVCIHKRRNKRDQNQYDVPSTDISNHPIEQVDMKVIEKCDKEHDDHIYERINPLTTNDDCTDTEPTYSAVDALYEIIVQDDLMRLHNNVAYGNCMRMNRNAAYGVTNNTQ